jgi:hypothetical protein
MNISNSLWSSIMLKQWRKTLLVDKLSHPPSPGWNLETLSSGINGQLDRAVHFNINFDKAEDYGPKNKYLFHSLLSGLSLKHRLTHNSVMYATMEKGLEPHGPNNLVLNLQDPEVLVVGTSIQLLLHGSALPTEAAGPRYRRSAEVVAKNLKDQKLAGTVKDPHAIQVLEAIL